MLLLAIPWTSKADDINIDQKNLEISHLASTIVGRDITVHCEDLSQDENGHAIQVIMNGESTFEPDIWLQKDICVGLHMLLHYVPKHFVKQSTWQQDRYNLMGTSALVLTHEAYHIILNSGNEGVVECAAYHHVQHTINLFTLPRKVAIETWRSARISHLSLLPVYRTVC